MRYAWHSIANTQTAHTAHTAHTYNVYIQYVTLITLLINIHNTESFGWFFVVRWNHFDALFSSVAPLSLLIHRPAIDAQKRVVMEQEVYIVMAIKNASIHHHQRRIKKCVYYLLLWRRKSTKCWLVNWWGFVSNMQKERAKLWESAGSSSSHWIQHWVDNCWNHIIDDELKWNGFSELNERILSSSNIWHHINAEKCIFASNWFGFVHGFPCARPVYTKPQTPAI